MDRELFRFDERSYQPRRKTNHFAWTVTLLLLTGLALTVWLASLYIFGQPERPDSYRILQKLHKIEAPRRFELTAAPKGEFLNAQQIFERYSAMRPAELTQANAELCRNYIRNFQQVRGLVPYVVGRYDVMEARSLTSNDIFTTGVVALTRAVDRGELLMEHLYPGDPRDVSLMKQTLTEGLEIKLERTHDLSTIIHAERLADGRLLITTIPLLYGSYTVTHGTGTFSLEPPDDLNLVAGWPLFKDPQRRKAEIHYASYLAGAPPSSRASVPIAGVNTPPGPPENELIRVEPALPAEGVKVAGLQPGRGSTTLPSESGRVIAGRQKSTLSPKPSMSSPSPAIALAKAASTPLPSERSNETAKPIESSGKTAPLVSPATSSARPTGTPPMVLPALPVTAADENALASTAGGGNWKTFEPGKMPVGRLISTSELNAVADSGLSGERYYLKGQFVVNFADANRAVLRPQSKLDRLLPFGASSTRIIVEFPAGFSPPAQGAVINRDEARPYEITEVRKQSDGQLNVFVREIMRP